MQVPLVQIGDQKGISIPHAILTKYAITESVELVLEQGFIILKPTAKARAGWEEAFRAMHENGEDVLLIPDVFEDETY